MCIRSVDVSRLVGAGAAAAVATMVSFGLAGAQGYPSKFEFGQPATEQEIAAVAIAIPVDGRGLPPGKGDYAAGKRVYETNCAACHGADLLGVANIPDMPSGAQLRLIGGRGTLTSQKPILTVESYWPYATTLFDYIRRAMPFQAPSPATTSMRSRPTSWSRPRSSTNRRCSTPRRCPRCRCRTATASFPIRGRRSSDSYRKSAASIEVALPAWRLARRRDARRSAGCHRPRRSAPC
jgi:hypothetical protein